MNSDIAIPVNWFLVVALVALMALWIAIWNHPATMRKMAARYLARAEALERSRDVYEKSLRRWNKQLGIPENTPSGPRPALRPDIAAIRSGDV
jgi:hypothetical protein